jgi:CubicO group peptidase (beta-lactamase class C family)
MVLLSAKVFLTFVSIFYANMKTPFFIISFLFATSAALAQLQTAIESIKSHYNLMGISVVSACNGEVTGSYHAGYKDYARSLYVDDSAMYRIASISKLVTATGLMTLYDQGLFSLDDDVSDYLGFAFRNPSWPQVPITFRMLLSHTSSFQDGSGYSSFLSATYGSVNPPIIQALTLPGGTYYSTNMWRTEKPGTYFVYSNANFGIVATLIERLSNTRFDIFMKNRILDPLGIAGSFNVSDIKNINNVAVLYRKSGGAWVAQIDNYQGVAPSPIDYSGYTLGTNGFIFSPQGGLRCSALDLAKIMLLHTNGGVFEREQIVSSETLAEMHTPQWTYNGSNGDNYYGLFRSWGLGVQITTNTIMGDIVYPNVQMFGHAGEAYGLVSDLYFDPVKRAGVIFLTNGAFNGYAYGTNSAFYRVEEAVFNATHQGDYVSCNSTDLLHTENLNVSIFPNPTIGITNIQLPVGTSANYTIFNAMGCSVVQGSLHNDFNEINISQLSSGMYILQLKGVGFMKSFYLFRLP